MRIAIDTSRYSDFARGDQHTTSIFEHADRVYVPFTTLAELRAGFLGGTKSAVNEQNLQKFLNQPSVETLYADEQTTHHFARLFHQLRRQGTPIPTNDIWIGALCVQYDLLLCARDQHFDHLPQLPRI